MYTTLRFMLKYASVMLIFFVIFLTLSVLLACVCDASLFGGNELSENVTVSYELPVA